MGRKGEKHPMYTCKEEVDELIQRYFKECEGKPLLDDEGKPVFDKYGYPVIIGRKPPTITGLALALGFTNRQSLLNYQARPEFRDTITIAKSRVEQYTEERLFDKEGSNGARFSLQCNFKGWKDEATQDVAQGSAVVKIICDIPKDKEVVIDNGDKSQQQ